MSEYPPLSAEATGAPHRAQLYGHRAVPVLRVLVGVHDGGRSAVAHRGARVQQPAVRVRRLQDEVLLRDRAGEPQVQPPAGRVRPERDGAEDVPRVPVLLAGLPRERV